MNQRGILITLACSLLACSFGHAQDQASQPVLQLTGGGEVAQWDGEPLDDPGIGQNTIEWRYPVFKGGDKAALARLNAWTRTISLAALLSFDDALQ